MEACKNRVDVALGARLSGGLGSAASSPPPASAPGPAPRGAAPNQKRSLLPSRPLRPPIGGGRSPGAASMATRRTGTPRWPPSRAAGATCPPAAAVRFSPPSPPGSCRSCRSCRCFPPPPPPVTTAYPAATRWGDRGSSGGCEGC